MSGMRLRLYDLQTECIAWLHPNIIYQTLYTLSRFGQESTYRAIEQQYSMSDQDDETDSDVDGVDLSEYDEDDLLDAEEAEEMIEEEEEDLTDAIPEEARETYPEESLSEADDEELLQEYYDTVHHLGVCDSRGQIDMTERRWEGILKEELLSRMSEDYTPTYWVSGYFYFIHLRAGMLSPVGLLQSEDGG